MFLKSNKSTTVLISLIFSSCATIKPTTPKYSEQTTKAPYQQIKDFTKDTEQIQLTQAIKEQKIVKKDEHFLRPIRGKKVNFWINYFTNRNKDGLQRFIHNGERYRPIVESIFTKYGLPKELYYVGIIESGFQNRARSHAGAVGPWQFIKATGRRYGLKVTRGIDERKNIYKSTQAAALYFQDLYNIFGSWELALAAYNAGEYGIIRRIRGANTREYYELSRRKIIPKETRNYVPKVLAVMEILNNPNKYGFTIPKLNTDLYTKTSVKKVYGSTTVARLAKKYKVPVRTIKHLNQDIMTNSIPYVGRSGYEIFIPGSGTTHLTNITDTKPTYKAPKRRTYQNVNIHKVRKNESLYSISKRYNIRISTLKQFNKLRSNTIYKGQRIKIPSNKRNSKILYSYIVKKGDNLVRIAKRFKTRINHLKKINRLKKSSIFAGQKIKVPPYKLTHYIVKKGDILSKIARRNSTTVRQLKTYNNFGRSIYPGQKIIIDIKRI